jgi:hypothetical protein
MDANFYTSHTFIANYHQPPLHYRDLITSIKTHGDQQTQTERVQVKGKGREVLLRFGGETLPKGPSGEVREEPAVPTDPRKLDGYHTVRARSVKMSREDLVQVTYEVRGWLLFLSVMTNASFAAR